MEHSRFILFTLDFSNIKRPHVLCSQMRVLDTAQEPQQSCKNKSTNHQKYRPLQGNHLDLGSNPLLFPSEHLAMFASEQDYKKGGYCFPDPQKAASTC